ncbi:hypothetical protein [Flavobacterium chungnamense]|uniref:Uncharacterized protein n=1 Tax=Flavobacterium chungnamense TaxID=706182 RepID=A0ABP7UUX1_9FLAO
MEDISKLNFVCVVNENCPANFDKTAVVFDYNDTFAVPDKKNETCCRYCNSVLFEEQTYLNIILEKKRKLQQKIILLIISILVIVTFFCFIFFK